MPIIIQLIYSEGITPENYKWFTSDFMNKYQAMSNPKVLQLEEIMPEDGCMIIH